MPKYLYLFLFIVGNYIAMSQNLTGITHKKDTSFTNYSAYQQAFKQYPNILLVKAQANESVFEVKSLVNAQIGEKKLILNAYIPKNRKNKKAILIIHGGGWRTGDFSQHIPMAQKLAEMGYACFTPEYRLSTEALYPAAVYDLKAAIRWVRAHSKQYHFNPEKIGIIGFSAGGQLAALLGTTNGLKEFEGNLGENSSESSDIKAVVDIDGILAFIHPESGEGDDSKQVSAATHWFGYSKIERPDIWHNASALTHVNPNTAPILFLNSSVERMHAGRQDFLKKLEKFNIYSEVFTFENSPHTFCLFEPWFSPTVKHIDDFFKKTL